MIFPTLRVQVWKLTGSDVYGQPRFFRLKDELASPVRMDFTTQHTTIRTDSGGSHGQAQENVATVVILVRPNTAIKADSKLVIGEHTLRVIRITERYAANGPLDHYEIHCEQWV